MIRKEQVLWSEIGESEQLGEVRECECQICESESDVEIKQSHHQMNLLLSRMNESQRRWYVGWLSNQSGGSSERELSRITGLATKTIRRGRRELREEFKSLPMGRIRQPGGGRHLTEKKNQS
jgi:hypothetical protein